MRLESFRDNKTGQLMVRGDGFSVVIEKDGRVALNGKCTLAEPVPTNLDEPSPRSRPAIRKRGAR
jgi:hypothetical protein